MKYHEGSIGWSVIVAGDGATTVRVGEEMREYKTIKQAIRHWPRKKDPAWLKSAVNKTLKRIQKIEGA